MTNTQHRIFWLAVVLSVLSMVAIAAAMWPASAAAADKGATTLTMQAPKEGVAGTILLSAKLTGPDGKAVVNAPISFLFKVDVLGQTEALLGTVPTTVSGTASWVYRVRQDGPVEFLARYKGSSSLAAAAAPVITYQVTGAPAAEVAEGSRVSLAGQFVPWAAAALVITVWLTLLAVAVRTVVLVPSAARGLAPDLTAVGGVETQAWQADSEPEPEAD